jgi:hypothetical protein
VTPALTVVGGGERRIGSEPPVPARPTVAILVDATVVRMVLVASVMQLLGRANWWIPGWLERLLPHSKSPWPRRARD